MMKSSGTIEINRPIDEVFERTIQHVADWSRVVQREEVLDEQNAGGLVTTLSMTTEENGRVMEFKGTVTRYEPPLARGGDDRSSF